MGDFLCMMLKRCAFTIQETACQNKTILSGFFFFKVGRIALFEQDIQMKVMQSGTHCAVGANMFVSIQFWTFLF